MDYQSFKSHAESWSAFYEYRSSCTLQARPQNSNPKKAQMSNLRSYLIFNFVVLILGTAILSPISAIQAEEEVDAIPTRGLRTRWRLNRSLREKKEKEIQEQEEKLSMYKEKNQSYPPRGQVSLRMKKVHADALVNTANLAIEISQKRVLTINHHTPWQILHGTLAFRDKCLVNVGRKQMTSIEWLSKYNPRVGDQYLFEKTPYGARTHKYTKPYDFEGHPNQFLGILAMSGLPLDHEFTITGGRKVTMGDMVENAKKDLNAREEVAWSLWFLSHYLEPDEEWINNKGEFWSIEKLVEEELQSDVYRSACGGTHGLFAIAFARNNYLQKSKNKVLSGVWVRAEQKINRFIAEAKSVQRSNGSFPTKYFKGFGDPKDISERLASSGHMMEWLMIALPEERLREPWVRRGIYYLSTQVLTHRNHRIDCGPFYHAMDALVIYRDRILHKKSPAIIFEAPQIQVTQKPNAKRISETKKVAKADEQDMENEVVDKTPVKIRISDKSNGKPAKTSMPNLVAPQLALPKVVTTFPKAKTDTNEVVVKPLLSKEMVNNKRKEKLAAKAESKASKAAMPVPVASMNTEELNSAGWKRRARIERRKQRMAKKKMRVEDDEFELPEMIPQTAIKSKPTKVR